MDTERFDYSRVINECAWGLRRRAQECAPYRQHGGRAGSPLHAVPRNDLGRSKY